MGDGTMRAAQCFVKRTKGQVFRWGGQGLGLCFSMAGECVSDRCERWPPGVECGSRPGLKTGGDWLNLRLCRATPAVKR